MTPRPTARTPVWSRPLTLALAVLALAACASDRRTEPAPGAPTVEARPEPPAYEEVAQRYNQRASRLSRVWARATVQMDWTDDRAKRRHEQGEGHFQLLQPAGLALSVGKLGEVLFWLGCDSERYWLFERGDADRAAIGRHTNTGQPCSRDLGAPVHPLDLIELLGATPLPQNSSGVGPSPGQTLWSNNGAWLIVDAPARSTIRRLFLDPATYQPVRIELFDPANRDSPAVVATLEDYAPVALAGVGGFFPELATRVEIRSGSTDDRVVLHLTDMSDGKRANRLSPEVFDFEALRAALGPRSVEVLDADCPHPALSP